jgi:hypothetical protein
LDINHFSKAILVLALAYEFMVMNSETSVQSEILFGAKEGVLSVSLHEIERGAELSSAIQKEEEEDSR